MNKGNIPLLDQIIREEQLPDDYLAQAHNIIQPLASHIRSLRETKSHHNDANTPLIVGISGAQGSGKSTLARVLQTLLVKLHGLSAISLSIDDIYLTRAARSELAGLIHPLLKTRGVPGTHDVALGLETLTALLENRLPVSLPRFSKAHDDRIARSEWPLIEQPVDIVLFEGWCIGARPQPDEALETPINPLERDEDLHGIWRKYVNEQLKHAYPALWNLLDLLVFLKVPSFECVYQWREEQEAKLRAKWRARENEAPGHIMSVGEVTRFIQHYERITRWNLDTLPDHAELVLELQEDHSMKAPLAKTKRKASV